MVTVNVQGGPFQDFQGGALSGIFKRNTPLAVYEYFCTSGEFLISWMMAKHFTACENGGWSFLHVINQNVVSRSPSPTAGKITSKKKPYGFMFKTIMF